MHRAVSLLVRRRDLARSGGGYYNPPRHSLGKVKVATIVICARYGNLHAESCVACIYGFIPSPGPCRYAHGCGGMHPILPYPANGIAYVRIHDSRRELKISHCDLVICRPSRRDAAD
jgi:hypothetical protein